MWEYIEWMDGRIAGRMAGWTENCIRDLEEFLACQ